MFLFRSGARWLVVVGMFLFGCATTGGSGGGEPGLVVGAVVDDAVAVTARASERWGLLLKGRLDDAYEYLSPGTRAMLAPEHYKARMRAGLWQEAGVADAKCQGEICRVTVNVKYALRKRSAVAAGETVLEETWIKEGGSWWFVPRR